MKLSDFTTEQVQAARHYAAQPNLNCAGACMNKGYFADHISVEYACSYQLKQMREAQSIINGDCDHNFTVFQRMEGYLTGKATPLLPKEDNK